MIEKTIIDILGTEYSVVKRNVEEDFKLKENEAYCDCTTKEIVLTNDYEIDENTVSNIQEHIKTVLRHEVVHAFLYESGLHYNSYSVDGWAVNEEMVDWFAIQSPKIFKVYKELDIL